MAKKIKEVMTPDVKTVTPETTVREAALKMRENDIGALPVFDGNTLLGIVTDRDIVLRMAARGGDSNHTRVSDIMTGPLIFCFQDQEVEEVARIMEVQQIRRLVVLDSSRHLVGIVTLGDIAVKTGREDLAGEILEKVSEHHDAVEP